MKTSPDQTVSAETMLVAATFDPSCRPFFYKHICDCEIFAGVTRRHPASMSPQYAAVQKGGGNFLAVFTDEKMVPPSFDCVKMKLGDFLALAAAKNMTLNPGQPVSKDFSEEEISALLSGELSRPKKLWRGVNPPAKVSAPSFSEQYSAPLRMLLKNHPCVESSWFGDVEMPGPQGLRGTWVGLTGSGAAHLAEAAQECAVMLATSDSPPPAFGVEVLAGTVPPAPASVLHRKNRGGEKSA